MPRIWTNIQIEEESKELLGFLSHLSLDNPKMESERKSGANKSDLNIWGILRNDESPFHCLLNHFWKKSHGNRETRKHELSICICIQIAHQHFQSFQYWHSMFYHFFMYLFSSLLNILLVFVFVFVTFKHSAGLHTVDSCCPHRPYCFPENFKIEKTEIHKYYLSEKLEIQWILKYWNTAFPRMPHKCKFWGTTTLSKSLKGAPKGA